MEYHSKYGQDGVCVDKSWDLNGRKTMREKERERERGERWREKDIVKRGWDMLLSVKAIEGSKVGFSFSCLAKKICKGVELLLALQINES